MAAPAAETPPTGLDANWLGVWRHALKVMKDRGTWEWELGPLLAEYVLALQAAEFERRNDGRATDWDRHANRAARLADVLLLTPTSRRRHGIGSEEEDRDEFAGFTDELAQRRSQIA